VTGIDAVATSLAGLNPFLGTAAAAAHVAGVAALALEKNPALVPEQLRQLIKQTAVDLGPPGVVDPGDHVRHAERLARDPGGEDVRVVAAAHRRERVGVVDAGLDERVPVEADPGDPLALELAAEPAERIGVLVDDGDRVAAVLDELGQGRAGPAAAHDHEVH